MKRRRSASKGRAAAKKTLEANFASVCLHEATANIAAPPAEESQSRGKSVAVIQTSLATVPPYHYKLLPHLETRPSSGPIERLCTHKSCRSSSSSIKYVISILTLERLRYYPDPDSKQLGPTCAPAHHCTEASFHGAWSFRHDHATDLLQHQLYRRSSDDWTSTAAAHTYTLHLFGDYAECATCANFQRRRSVLAGCTECESGYCLC
ncbi:putative protein of unknown function [Pseudozyma hubeiensis SY62]|uniref:Uncharacterized protein n=1 Tax=Pseudozyma hubeiensis (strain SY62) TaxID=1305764 RepID=R9NY82_PSEHS|nr:putative protein of unknown function [Pseudozyma hubeiensis SY62]GAC93718.1 putative protein of unknown function [Pseudozyma hubeiensis SY62]